MLPVPANAGYWKDADPDIPFLKDAKEEHNSCNSSVDWPTRSVRQSRDSWLL